MPTLDKLIATYGINGEYPGRGFSREEYKLDRFTRLTYWQWVLSLLEFEMQCEAAFSVMRERANEYSR